MNDRQPNRGAAIMMTIREARAEFADDIVYARTKLGLLQHPHAADVLAQVAANAYNMGIERGIEGQGP